MPVSLEARKRAAAERAEKIRLGLQSTAVLYAKAVTEGDWSTLGYASISAWREAEFGPVRFKADYRKEISALLTAKGWTLREIEAATGASDSTIARDLREAGASGEAPGSRRQQSARGRERARRTRNLDGVPAGPGRRIRLRRNLIAQVTALGDFRAEDYGPDETDQVTGLLADLNDLGAWHDRQVRAVGKYLHDAGVRARIAKLRDVAGRTPEEAATHLAKAEELERRLGARLEGTA